MRILVVILGSVLGLLVIAALFVWLSARASLDHEFEHTRSTESLPVYSKGAVDGLVQIPARAMMFRARVAGLASKGPAVIMLHGFPETSTMWAPLIEEAVAAGFRVVAFDQRGYSPGARPEEIESYALGEVVADLFAIADVVGFEEFHLVAHDWGSIAGWQAAAKRPDRILSYASLSIPHPGAIRAANEGEGVPGYVRFFQREGLAETMLLASDAWLLRSIYSEMPSDLLKEYLAVFAEPGAMRAALNWYRAQREFIFGDALAAEVDQPVLFVAGLQDLPFLVRPEIPALHPKFVIGPLEVVELDAGHWLMQEETDRSVAAVMSHLLSQPKPGGAIDDAGGG